MRNFYFKPTTFATALFIYGQVFAQTQIIPPLTPSQIADKDKDAAKEAAVQGAISLPSEVIRGAGVLQHQIGERGAIQIIQGAKTASNIISSGVAGAKILEGTVKDGQEGFYRESAQFALEKGIDTAAQAGVHALTGLAVAGGAAAATAAGVAGASYAAGNVAGTYIKKSASIGRAFGYQGPLEDEIDRIYFEYTPDSLKEWASGTPQVNINDPAVMQKMLDDARRKRKQATFDAIQQENAEQQRQLAASRAAMIGGEQSAPSPSAGIYSDNGLSTIQTILNAAKSQYPTNPTLVSQAKAVAPQACKLDPSTGCHPGHDEKSHPGGCKKC